MPLTEREQSILALLSDNSIVSVSAIAKKLFVSEPTARRYLTALAEQGLVIRTHGGVVINNLSENRNIPLYLRLSTMTEDKKRIASNAARLIRDGNVIFLDASSSAFHMLSYLDGVRDLLVVTNSLKTAITLAEMGIRTISLGGTVSSANFGCHGYETLETVKNINADFFFFSCDALSDEGELTDNSQEESILRQHFMKFAKTNVLLVDSSKLHKKCWYNLCSLSDIDYCFCNAELPENLTAMLRKAK